MLGTYATSTRQEPSPDNSVRLSERKPGGAKSFSCAIDGLCYATLDTALVHVRMQHGIVVHGEMLVRAKPIGGTL